MENLDKVIFDYLKRRTNYAVLITGKWGVGKTYYYRTCVSQAIEGTETLENGSIKYKSIHISLFGLSSIKDIQLQVFLSLFPILKSKKFKFAKGLGMALARGIIAVKGLRNFDDYITDLAPDEGDFLNFNNLVICFDDLERKSPELPLAELIGFINLLVETNGAKIILIANEDKIEDEIYLSFKEKIVGITVEFSPDFQKNFRSIIENRYGGFSAFSSFMMDKEKLILEFSEVLQNNLRTLIFALDNMQDIFSKIKIEIIDGPAEESAIIDENFSKIIRFAMGVSIEFKIGKITSGNREELDISSGEIDWDKVDFSNVSLVRQDEEQEIEKSYKARFIEKYYPQYSDFLFFESIYSFITGACAFKIENFKSEVRSLFHLEDNKVRPQYELFNRLHYSNCFNLNNSEYKNLTKQMVAFAEEGIYDLSDYLTIFHYAIRFDNLLNYNLKSLKQRIKKGIKKANPNLTSSEILNFHLNIPMDAPFKEDLFEIKKYILLFGEKAQKKHVERKAKEILGKMEEDWEEFFSLLTDRQQIWASIPVFTFSSAYQIFLILNRYPNSQILAFADLIKSRYRSFPHQDLKKETTFLKVLLKKIGPTSKSRSNKNLKNHLLSRLCNELEVAIKQLEEN